MSSKFLPSNLNWRYSRIKRIKEIRVKVFLRESQIYLYLAFINFSKEVIGKKEKLLTCMESTLLIIQIQKDF